MARSELDEVKTLVLDKNENIRVYHLKEEIFDDDCSFIEHNKMTTNELVQDEPFCGFIDGYTQKHIFEANKNQPEFEFYDCKSSFHDIEEEHSFDTQLSISTISGDDYNIKENELLKDTKTSQKTEEGAFKCCTCLQAFASANGLIDHFRNHKTNLVLRCYNCGKSFSRRENLTSHVIIHSDSKPFVCTICSTSFTRNSHLARHMHRHSDDKPYNCDICNAGYTEISNLKYHIMTHTGEKPYKCSKCSASFIHKGGLTSHNLVHSNKRPIKCPVCNACFKHGNYLKVHMRTHTGERPYKCSVCGKDFAYRTTLRKHLLNHKNEKFFECPLYKKLFTDKEKLKKRHVIHGDKPYVCNSCNKSFVGFRSFIKHSQKHNNIKLVPTTGLMELK